MIQAAALLLPIVGRMAAGAAARGIAAGAVRAGASEAVGAAAGRAGGAAANAGVQSAGQSIIHAVGNRGNGGTEPRQASFQQGSGGDVFGGGFQN